MRSAEYLDAVEAELKRLTRGEQEDVRRELAAHLEDHMDSLRAIGCTDEEADERAAEAMGDPVETGRAISALYRPFWLWVERIAAVFVVVASLWALSFFGTLNIAWSSVYSRFCPPDDREAVRVSEHMTIGDDVVRLYGVKGYRPGEDCEVVLWLRAYDRYPFGGVHQGIWGYTTLRTGNTEGKFYAFEDHTDGAAWSSWLVTCRCLRVPLHAGDTSVTLRYERFGQVFEHTFALPEVGA